MALSVIQSPPAFFKDIISPKYIFGYRGDFKNNIFLHPEPIKIIYPAGNNIVIYNTDNKTQSFLHSYPGTSSITAMTVSPSKRYLAWAEEADTGIIVVQDLQANKKKTLTSIESGSKTYISLSFSNDESRGLVSLTGPPEWNLIFWDWNKNKSLGSIKLASQNKLYHCFYHPKEVDLVGIIGNNIFKIYKYTPEALKQKDSLITKKDSKEVGHSQNYLSYCFLKDENMVIGTDQGELLLFNNNWEYRMVLSSSPFDGFPIETIITYKRGFVIGGPNCTIFQYEKHDGDLKMPYIRLDKKIQNKESKSRITSMMLSADDEYLIIGTEDGHFFQTLFSRDINEEKFEPVVQNFHTNQITGLDVCIRKALVATCSLDKTVKVWNYSEYTSTISAEYDEEALALAFHPSGFHLVVAFQDKIRMLNIFDEHLITFKEINNIKACREISFCNGGHLFAIANTNIIHVYQTYTGENPPAYVFRGHTGKVVSIHWLDNDLGFISASNDGTIFEFRLEDSSQKIQMMNNTNFMISSVVACSFEKAIYIAGTDLNSVFPDEKYILEIRYSAKEMKDHENIIHDYGKKYNVSEPTKIFTGANIAQVLLSKSNKLFFFGTDEKDLPGSIRVTRYPFTTDILEYQTHSKGITKMKITFDDNYMFTTGNDGCLIIYEVRDKDTKIKKDKVIGFAEEFLIQKDRYNEKMKNIENLKGQIEEFKLQNEINTKIQMKEKDEKIRQLNETIERDAENDREKYDSLLKSKEKMQSEYEDKKNQIKAKHEQMKRTIEADYKQKIALEIQRFEELEKEKSQELKDFNTFRYEYEEKYQREIFEKKNYYEGQLMREKALRDKILNEKQEILDDYNMRHDLLEDKAEGEIEKITVANEEKIKKIRDNMEKAQVDKTKMKDKYDTESQKLEDQKTKLKEIKEDIQQIEEANKQLNKELEGHTKEIEEREKTITDKSRRIIELKKKTQELEKFKFVLDYKIKELKRNIGPREEEIAKMKEQIANMNAEILHFKRTNDNLWLIVKDLHFRQKGMKIEIEGLEKVKSKNKNYIISFETEVSECYQSVANFKLLKKRILGLYNKYVQNEKKKLEITVDLQAEFINQREHLETNVKSLKLKFEKNMEAHLQDNKRIMKENVNLIKEINDLKREKKILKDDVAKKQTLAASNLVKKKNVSGFQTENYEDVITIQREEVKEMQDKIKEISQKIQVLKQKRPPSSGKKLPVLEIKT